MIDNNFVTASPANLVVIRAINDFHVSGIPKTYNSDPVPVYFRCQETQSFGFTNEPSYPFITKEITASELALGLTYNPANIKCWVPFDFGFTDSTTSPVVQVDLKEHDMTRLLFNLFDAADIGTHSITV